MNFSFTKPARTGRGNYQELRALTYGHTTSGLSQALDIEFLSIRFEFDAEFCRDYSLVGNLNNDVRCCSDSSFDDGLDGPRMEMCAIVCNNSSRRANVERASDAAGVADWVSEQRRRKWRWAGHVTRMCDRRWTKLLLDWIPTGRRRVGRPTMRWEDTLEEYAKRQLDGQNWTTVAKTREMWRQLEDGFVMYVGSFLSASLAARLLA